MESLGIGLFNQHLEPFRMVIQPGEGIWEDQVSHSGEEFVHCLDGEIDYAIGDRVFTLEHGDSLLFDATLMHGYHNRTNQQTAILTVFMAYQDQQHIRELHLRM